MSELRRHIMMQQGGDFDELGYYKKGLLLHLDGIDYGGVSGEWKDRISGRVFTRASGSITLRTNGYYIGGCMRLKDQLFVNELINISKKGITYELACSGNPDRERPYLFKVGAEDSVSSIRGMSWYTYNNNKYLAAHSNRGSAYSGVQMPTYTPITASLTASGNAGAGNLRWIVNKNVITSLGPGRTSLSLGYTDSIILGAWSTVIPYSTFYSLRIYDEKIPDDMRLHNQQIDNERFNLGL